VPEKVPENRSDGKNKILVLGLGNEVLGDESLGLLIVNDIAESKLFPEIDFSCTYTGGLNLLEYIQGYDSLFIIDTACGNEFQAGTVQHYTCDNYRETLHMSSEHDTSFSVTLETGAKLGFRIPDHIYIIAIEIYCDLYLTEELSDNIKQQFDKIKSEIIKFIKNICGF
jgi:hydrogenase maturation protease